MSFALSNGTNSLGKSVQSDVIAARNIRTDALTTNRLTVTGGAISIQEEGVDVLSSSTLNFVGSSVAASDVGGVATVTISSSASTLASVLTAGNDGNGLNVTNIGSLTFDTATNTKGISIGTDSGAATTVRASQIAIGTSASCTSTSNIGSIVIGYASDTSSYPFGFSNNVTIGTASLTSGYAVYGVCVGFNGRVSTARGVAIGAYAATTGLGDFSVAIGSQATVTGLQGIAIGRTAGATHNFSMALGAQAETDAVGQLAIAVGSPAVHFRTDFSTDTAAITPGAVVLGNATAMMNVKIGATTYRLALFQ